MIFQSSDANHQFLFTTIHLHIIASDFLVTILSKKI